MGVHYSNFYCCFFDIHPNSKAGIYRQLKTHIIDRLRDLKIVLRDPSIWRLGPLVWITGSSHIALLTLWAGPWFSNVASYSRMMLQLD